MSLKISKVEYPFKACCLSFVRLLLVTCSYSLPTFTLYMIFDYREGASQVEDIGPLLYTRTVYVPCPHPQLPLHKHTSSAAPHQTHTSSLEPLTEAPSGGCVILALVLWKTVEQGQLGGSAG